MSTLKETRLYKISIFSTPLPCPQMALRCHPIVVKQCKTTAPGTIIMEIDCKILDSYRPDPKTKAIEAKKKSIQFHFLPPGGGNLRLIFLNNKREFINNLLQMNQDVILIFFRVLGVEIRLYNWQKPLSQHNLCDPLWMLKRDKLSKNGHKLYQSSHQMSLLPEGFFAELRKTKEEN